MLNKILKLLDRPLLYTKTETKFWNDEHISEQMLAAHLDPEFEGASRKLEFIEKSVRWISKTVPPASYPLMLDVGCGPGIYAERMTRAGYKVTGIDFSQRSIDYARHTAAEQNLDISYIYKNYLHMKLDKVFDFAIMIYCDYGALSDTDRRIIMNKLYNHLRPGGRLLLDVFSTAQYNSFKEHKNWKYCPAGGFWRKGEYASLSGCYKYPESSVTLEQIIIIEEDVMTPYYLWNTCFTEKALMKEAQDAGFKVCDVYGDVAGSPTTEGQSPDGSLTLAILLEK